MTSGWICTEEERATGRENYSSRCWVEIVACDAPAGTSDNDWDYDHDHDYEDSTRVVEREEMVSKEWLLTFSVPTAAALPY